VKQIQSQQIGDTMNQSDRISRDERHELICEGLLQGKSLSAIATELECHDGMIQRDFNFLLRRHRATETVLIEALRQDAMYFIREYRLPCEAGTGQLSDVIAHAGLKYLMTQDLVQGDEVMILDQVGRNLCALGDVIAMPRENPERTFVRCERGELPSCIPDRIDYFISAITRALPLIAPEILIRERAIEKMQEAVKDGKRRSQLAAPTRLRGYTNRQRAREKQKDQVR
jgi:hypothetical protein